MSDEPSARDDSPSEYDLAAFLAKTMVFHAVLVVVLAYVLGDAILAEIRLSIPLAYGGAVAFLLMSLMMAIHARTIRKSGGLEADTAPDEDKTA
jgi:hypothetical protein